MYLEYVNEKYFTWKNEVLGPRIAESVEWGLTSISLK